MTKTFSPTPSFKPFAKPFALASFSLVLFVAGCGAPKPPAQSSQGHKDDTPQLKIDASSASEPNTLVLVSPHGREIQGEFERGFKATHPNVKLQWIDQGGTSDDLNFVLEQFKKKKTGGIGVDLFFGGGADTFHDLEKQDVLQPLPSSYQVPAALNGVPLRGEKNTWVAAALSGFGVLYNKTIAARDKLPVPRVWADLGDPRLQNRIALADPRHSGSAHMAYEIILQAQGWKRGWQTLAMMAANTRSFSPSSSKLLDDVSTGEAVMAPSIDFYAATKIASAGGEKLGYVDPQGQRVVTADPIGVLRGAPHQKLAQEFVAFVMSPQGQKLWMLKKGAVGGPVNNALYRLAAVPSSYKPISPDSLIRADPYAGRNSFKFDPAKSGLRRRVLDDLIGAVLVDNKDDLRSSLSTHGAARTTFMPLSEAQANTLAARWNDKAFRNTSISQWTQAARAHYQAR